jgi:hypothetical protein
MGRQFLPVYTTSNIHRHECEWQRGRPAFAANTMLGSSQMIADEIAS